MVSPIMQSVLRMITMEMDQCNIFWGQKSYNTPVVDISNGISTSTGFKISAKSGAGGNFGVEVKFIGDLNNDGYSDL